MTHRRCFVPYPVACARRLGPILEAYRERLPEIDPETGQTKAEELLESAEAEALSGTVNGKRIARLLPRFRQLIDRIKKNS
jgi:DNA-binding transcriptional LysR family regulator